MSVKIVFECESDGSKHVCDAEEGETLVQVAARYRVTIQQTCGNVPSCTDCRVLIKQGLDSFAAPEGPEVRLMGNVSYITRERLACQAVIQKGDAVVLVPKPQKRKQKNFVGTKLYGKKE